VPEVTSVKVRVSARREFYAIRPAGKNYWWPTVFNYKRGTANVGGSDNLNARTGAAQSQRALKVGVNVFHKSTCYWATIELAVEGARHVTIA